MSEHGLTGREIAVVGMSGRFPKARDLAELWRNLRDGVEAVTLWSEEELAAAGVPRAALADPSYVRAGLPLEGVDLFDAEHFGYTPREAEILDPQQRLFLEQAWAALEDAGYAPASFPGLIGVYAGVAWNTYLLTQLVSHPELFEGGHGFQVFISNDKDFLPTRLSYKLNLKGPSLIVQTSCSTSLVAIHLACLSLLNYECDLALAGGVTIKVPQVEGYFYQDGGLASPDGHCRAFDERAAGTIFGSGAGVVVLKRLAEALADGDSIRAVIKGSAINNDGSLKVSYTAPSAPGQAEVIAAAQAVAGVSPETIGYVEAHGTGTSLGDPIEVAALTKVFREATAERGFCAIGSIKSNLGHLDAAAGVAGFLKTVLALQHGTIPPSLHFEKPNPKMDLPSSPFRVPTAASEWPRRGGVRRAGVSSFGVGGTNAHVIVEEAPAAPAPAERVRPWQVLTLSARTAQALEEAAEQLAEALAAPGAPDLADAAYTLQVGRTVFRHRRVVVCREAQGAAEALRRGGMGVVGAVDEEDPRERPVAFLFPGQGAQHPGMAADLYATEAGFRARFDRCAEVLRPWIGEDLRELVCGAADEGAAERLRRTAVAQPALFAVEWSLAGLWMDWGVRPQALLGHSVGEYVAACLAGVFSLENALELVAERGRLMQELPAGAMLAVPLGEAEVGTAIAAFPGLDLAALNEPARSVVSGPTAEVERLAAHLAERGIDSRPLHTSHAFHSAMMDPLVGPFAERVRKVRLAAPRIPFVSNLTGTWITDAQATNPEYWARHLRATVRFAAGLEVLRAEPERVLLEVGPGRTLATLAQRSAPAGDRTTVIASAPHPQDETPGGAVLAEAVGRLWLAGVAVDWAAYHRPAQEGDVDHGRRRVPLPTYPFQRQRYWISGNARAAGTGVGVAAEAPSDGLSRRSDPGAWMFVPSWTRAVPLRPFQVGSELGRRVRVVGEGGGLLSHLHSLPPGEGAPPPENSPSAGDEIPPLPGGRECGWERGPGGEGPDEIIFLADDAPLEAGVARLLDLARELASGPPCRLWVVARGAFSVTGGERVDPAQAALLAPCRVIPQEMPHLTCRFVDFDAGEEAGRAAELLLAELAAADSASPLVAYRHGRRWVQELVPAGWDDSVSPLAELRPEGVYLVTGGLDGVGWNLARCLAAPGRGLVLLEGVAEGSSRQERLRTLEETGARVRCFAVDFSDAAAVERAVLAGIDELGDLHGVIHAAGATGERAFRTIAESGAAELAWHSVPKVRGLLALEQALAGRQMDFRLLASSLATVLGGLGSCALAASDLYLEAVASSGETGWQSVAWDAWQDGGGLADVRADLAQLALSQEEGAEVLRRVLASATSPNVVVSTADPAARLARSVRRQEAARPAPSGALHSRPALPTPYAPPDGELERRLAEVWGRVFGFEQVGVHDNFFELGGDSFLAVQVVSRLRSELEMEIPVAKLYQGTTIRALARLLAEDPDEAVRRRAAQLEERREAMGQRQQFLRQRRERRLVAAGEPGEAGE